jgi:hypothetical protein
MDDGSDNWLKWYEERGMASYPSEEPYKKWQEPGGIQFLPDPKEAGRGFFYMYDKHQLFALKMVLKELKRIV